MGKKKQTAQPKHFGMNHSTTKYSVVYETDKEDRISQDHSECSMIHGFVRMPIIQHTLDLMKATRKSEREKMEYFLGNGALVNAHCGTYGVTPLHVAAFFGTSLEVDVLLCHGAKVNARDIIGRTALFHAAAAGKVCTLKLLLDSGADMNTQVHEEVSLEAVMFEDLEEELVFENPDFMRQMRLINDYNHLFPKPIVGDTALHIAAEQNHLDSVARLVNEGANIKDGTALLRAGWIALESAAEMERYADIVDLLIEHGSDVNISSRQTGLSPTFVAVRNGSVRAAMSLLDAGANPKAKGPYGRTVLHEAASQEFPFMVRRLLRYREFLDLVNTPDDNSKTPLHMAAENLNWNTLKVLIFAGGDLSRRTANDTDTVGLIYKCHPYPNRYLKEVFDAGMQPGALRKGEDIRNLYIALHFDVLAPPDQHNQMAVLQSILRYKGEEEAMYIFRHPLVSAFVNLKWKRLRYFFMLFLLIYTLYLLSFTTFIHYQFKYDRITTNRTREIMIEKHQSLSNFSYTCKVIVVFGCICMIAYFILLLAVFFNIVVRQIESWMCLACAVLSIVAINQDFINDTKGWAAHVSSCAILLAWLEMFLLLGRLPCQGYYGVVFTAMLRKVSGLFPTYIILTVSFAMGFVLLFRYEHDFSDPYHSYLKSLVMSMGEFEYLILFMNKDHYLRFSTRIIFIIYNILAFLALVHLMIHFAVIDAKSIKLMVRLGMHIKQTVYMSHLQMIITHRRIQSFPLRLRHVIEWSMNIPVKLVTYPVKSSNMIPDRRLPAEWNEELMHAVFRMKLDAQERELMQEDDEQGDEGSVPTQRHSEATNDKTLKLDPFLESLGPDLDGIKEKLHSRKSGADNTNVSLDSWKKDCGQIEAKLPQTMVFLRKALRRAKYIK